MGPGHRAGQVAGRYGGRDVSAGICLVEGFRAATATGQRPAGTGGTSYQPAADAADRTGITDLACACKDITVKFKQPVTRVWLATSQPELSYRMLPVENGTVKVPELRIWSMVIAETEGK